MNFIKKEISGWGMYPSEECYLTRPEEIDDFRQILEKRQYSDYIAYGLGRSYGDTPLNENNGVLLTNKLNKFLAFDPVEGIIECEAGVSFEEIIETFLPKGYFLPVTPGTKYVTVGGAISNDVHGKNHHIDGCFSEYIISFTLLIASGEMLNCSRTDNAEIFWATIGGIGLTGFIITVKFKLIKVETAYYDVLYEKANNIERALELFEESDDQYQYSVAWIDCLAKGSSLGRCVLMRGNHASAKQLIRGETPLGIQEKFKPNVPFNFPSITLNPLSIKLFNETYYSINPTHKSKIVDYNTFFYPLDKVFNWNRMYGKKGFIQYQAVFPSGQTEGLIKMLERLSSTNRASFLAVLKSSGEEGQGLLSFPKKGYTLALDIPMRENLIPFLRDLDQLVIRHGGRVYLAKDSTLEHENFKIMYPRWGEFLRIKNMLDPNQLFSSSMAKRLKILEG